MKITFFQTGGSIDKDYPRILQSYAFEIGSPSVKRILQRAKPNLSYRIITLFRKDSLDMTHADRMLVRHACLRCRYSNIIITHGTDTMIQTAKYLQHIPDKVIILTGAIRPETCIESDAAFNVGTAVGAIGYLPQGVYIAMNTRIYPWNTCRKDASCQFIEK